MATPLTKTSAEHLWKEFTPRIKHCDYIVLGVQSKQGNFALITSHGIPDKALRQLAKLIRDELKERKESRLLDEDK